MPIAVFFFCKVNTGGEERTKMQKMEEKMERKQRRKKTHNLHQGYSNFIITSRRTKREFICHQQSREAVLEGPSSHRTTSRVAKARNEYKRPSCVGASERYYISEIMNSNKPEGSLNIPQIDLTKC